MLAQPAGKKPIPLFNGKDLSGWTHYLWDGAAKKHLNLTDGSERPAGEWNKMESTGKGDQIIVYVNGDLVNHATKCGVTPGAISLQSEGALIHFRNICPTRL